MLSVKILLFSISLYWPSGLGEVLASADTQVADPKALDVDTNTLLPAAPPTPTSWSVISSDHTWNERDAELQVSVQDGPPTVIPVGSNMVEIPAVSDAPQGPPTVIPGGSTTYTVPGPSSPAAPAPLPSSTVDLPTVSTTTKPTSTTTTTTRSISSTTSSTPTPTSTTSTTSSTSSISTTSSSSSSASTTTTSSSSATITPPPVLDDSPTDKCWSRKECRYPFAAFASCYEEAGLVTDPNSRNDQSKKYQACLCKNQDFKTIALFNNADPPLSICLTCLNAAGIPGPDSTSPTWLFRWKIFDFCNTRDPNTYDLLRVLLSFSVAARVPATYTQIPAKVATLTGLEERFKSTPGMNLPTTIPQGIARPTPSPTGPWWERMLMFGDPIPTEYLAQVPAKWPYTAYGIGGKVGRTTKWPLTDVNRTGSTVAWVYASVLWNPRPLVEGKKGKEKEGEGEVWQPLLEGWTQGFLTETAIATGFGTTMGSTTAMGVSRTKASSETKTSATKTKASSTSDKDESSTTGISLGTSKGVRPNMTQSAVLPKDSDAGDFVSGSAIQDVKSKTDTAPMGFGGYVIPTGQHKVRQSTG